MRTAMLVPNTCVPFSDMSAFSYPLRRNIELSDVPKARRLLSF